MAAKEAWVEQPSDEVDEEAMDEFAKPDMQEALKKAYEKSTLEKLPDGTTRKYPMWRPKWEELGTGINLYFVWLMLLSVVLLVAGGASVVSVLYNFRGDRATKDDTWEFKTTFGNLSPAQRESRTHWPNGVMYLLSVLLYVGFCFAFTAFKDQEVKRIDRKSVTTDDYSVIVRNCPRGIIEPEDWKKYFEEQWGEVAAVAVGVSYGKSLYLKEKKEKLEKNICIRKMRKKDTKNMEDKLAGVTIKLDDVSRQSHHCCRVFVTFNSEMSRTRCLRAFNPWGPMAWLYRVWGCCGPPAFHKKYLRVDPAPSPSDVLWKNLYRTMKQRVFRDVFADFLAILLIAACAGMLWFVSLAKKKDNASSLLTFISPVVVVVVNQGIVIVLTSLAKWTKPHTRTEVEEELMGKLWLTQVINTGIIILFVGEKIGSEAWFRTTGREIIGILIADMVYSNLSRLIRPPDLFKRLVLAPRAYTQEQMDDLVVGPEFHLSDRYAAVLKTVTVAMLYAHWIPICMLIAGLALAIAFWVDRYNLLYSCQQPVAYKEELMTPAIRRMMFAVPGGAAILLTVRRDALWYWGVGVCILGGIALIRFHSELLEDACGGSRDAKLAYQGTGGKVFVDHAGLNTYDPPKIEGRTFQWKLRKEDAKEKSDSVIVQAPKASTHEPVREDPSVAFVPFNAAKYTATVHPVPERGPAFVPFVPGTALPQPAHPVPQQSIVFQPFVAGK